MGRPSTFTAEIADRICERLAGGESLKSICTLPDFPSERTVISWLNKGDTEPEKHADLALFVRQYACAREAQAERIFDEILEIADDGRNDWMTRQLGETEIEVPNHEHIQRSRLRVDARKWMAGKLAPKRYGDKLDLTSGGEKIGLAAVIAERRAAVAKLNDRNDG